MRTFTTGRHPRHGGIAVMTAFLLVPLLGMLAFAIDYGYLLKERSELQRAADAAALSAVRDLLPDAEGNQDLDAVRTAVRQYAANNVTDVSGFSVLDDDIEIGRFDPETVYTDFTILDDGVLDTVRVKLRRDSSANGPITLFFARVIGISDSDIVVTATAVLQKARYIRDGSGVLPFAVPKTEWDPIDAGEEWSIYGDGSLADANGNSIPGNWGTCDIGSEANSTSDMSNQILNGLQQGDLDALYSDGRIGSNTEIDSTAGFDTNADTGLSGGLKHAVAAIHGQSRLIPIYESVSGGGNNAEFQVVGWGVCEVVDSSFRGNGRTHVTIRKSHLFDGFLRPNKDLSAEEGFIEGAYTSPALVE